MQVLLVDPDGSLPQGVGTCLADDGWSVATAPDYQRATELAQEQGVTAVVTPRPENAPGDATQGFWYRNLMRAIDVRRIAAVLISGSFEGRRNADTLVDVARPDVSKEEIRGRLSMVRRYQATVKGMEREVENLQRISKRINQHFNEVDQEMRLAGRLQRDFLPQRVDPVGSVRFAAMFRPVTWVSGDIYDIFRIDESHVGFYVADAVGHGMAASLLTMFIKHAVMPKEIKPDGSYRILDPGEVMANLNEALREQGLPNCQFVTACYCLLNTETLELSFARGGHPYPLLIAPSGTVTELKVQGGLMGLFEGAEFPTTTTQLRPGEKLILYTDGIEVSFAPRENEEHSWEHYRAVFEELAHEPIQEIVRQLEAQLDAETGSLDPKDDLTIVGIQIDPAAESS